jgi:hypothetical protein
VIRVERVALPAGLRAIAQRDADGVLVIYVSDQLESRQQRAAVMEAVRASRRAGWRTVLPAGAGIAAFGSARLVPVRLLAGPAGRLWEWAGRLVARVRAQPWTAAGWAGATTAIVAGGVATGLVLSPVAGPRAVPSLGSRPGVSVSATAQPGTGPGPSSPGGGSRGRGGRGSGGNGSGGNGGSGSSGSGTQPGGGAGAPSASASAGGPGTGAPGGGGSSPPASQPAPAPGPTTPVATATPAPSSPQAPKPSPTPSASSPAGNHAGPCVDLLVIGICL